MENNIEENISLAKFTTFGIGGLARYFTVAKSIDELVEYLKWSVDKKLPNFILAGGSNLLVSDNGFDGLVIKNEIKGFEVDKFKIVASSGESLSRLVVEALKLNLSGLEWAIGIPGSIGGAVFGNTGAYGQSISSVVDEVEVFDLTDFKVKKFELKDCQFEYRNSLFRDNNNLIILSVILELMGGTKDDIQKKMVDNIKQRGKSHNVGNKTPGCYFKNVIWESGKLSKEELLTQFPEFESVRDRHKLPVGFLIESLGLAGESAGGAIISKSHANYIVNDNSATSDDVKKLAEFCKEKVYEKYKIKLKEEVQLVGF